MIYSLAPEIVATPSPDCGKHLDLGCCSFDIATDEAKQARGKKQ